MQLSGKPMFPSTLSPCRALTGSEQSNRSYWAGTTMNVLIVDDHPIVAEYLRGAAGRAIPDAVIRLAGDLEAAFESMRDTPADMVMLDLGLPGCGGIESLQRLRRVGATSRRRRWASPSPV